MLFSFPSSASNVSLGTYNGIYLSTVNPLFIFEISCHLISVNFHLFFSDVLCISVAPMFLAAAAPAPVFTSDGPPGMGPESGVGVSTGVY